jgi:hypothetical protein
MKIKTEQLKIEISALSKVQCDSREQVAALVADFSVQLSCGFNSGLGVVKCDVNMRRYRGASAKIIAPTGAPHLLNKKCCINLGQISELYS